MADSSRSLGSWVGSLVDSGNVQHMLIRSGVATGVQGNKDLKGELWGMENLLKSTVDMLAETQTHRIVQQQRQQEQFWIKRCNMDQLGELRPSMQGMRGMPHLDFMSAGIFTLLKRRQQTCFCLETLAGIEAHRTSRLLTLSGARPALHEQTCTTTEVQLKSVGGWVQLRWAPACRWVLPQRWGQERMLALASWQAMLQHSTAGMMTRTPTSWW